MDGIEAITRGWWRPSPGSVYPLLERMEGEGTIRKRDDGRYELTAKANAELEVSFGAMSHAPRTSAEVVAEIESLVSFAEDLNMTEPHKVVPLKGRLKALGKRLDELAG